MKKFSTTLLCTLVCTACMPSITGFGTDDIIISSPAPESIVNSTVEITGEARGNWFFEANFPVRILDKDGNTLVESYAVAEDEWMTEKFVPFRSTVEIDTAYKGPGTIVLSKANASGLPENDASIEMPIAIDTSETTLQEQALIEAYIKANINQLSPIDPVLGGTFFVTDITWKSNNAFTVQYEDGHIAVSANVTARVEDNSVEVTSFTAMEDAGVAKTIKELEQIPSELSITHFSEMRLEGKDLQYTKVSSNEAYTRYNITYTSNGLTISGIMNIPNGNGPFPLVLLNHGYIDPAVYTQGRGLKREQDYLARQGFAVLHSDYRGHAASDPSPDTRKIYDAGLEYSMDVYNAIQAVANSNLTQIDTSKIGMLGHSMGGGVTLNIITAYPKLVDAAVLYAPVHADAWANFTRWRDMREEGDNTRAALGTKDENPYAWAVLSSESYLSYIQTPILLFHGTKDADVPVEWSTTLEQNLEMFNKEVQYIVYEGEKHEFIAQWDDFMQRTARFFREQFAKDEPPPITWRMPMTDMNLRVTKKPFGLYVDPENSPVSPERFTGYHTGIDLEPIASERIYPAMIDAACTGPVVFKNWVSGYGGVIVQECELNGEPVTVLYGHIDLDTAAWAIKVGDVLEVGQMFAQMGKGNSKETDGERKHLHFAIHKGKELEFAGYVQNESELDSWIDPLSLEL